MLENKFIWLNWFAKFTLGNILGQLILVTHSASDSEVNISSWWPGKKKSIGHILTAKIYLL